MSAWVFIVLGVIALVEGLQSNNEPTLIIGGNFIIVGIAMGLILMRLPK